MSLLLEMNRWHPLLRLAERTTNETEPYKQLGDGRRVLLENASWMAICLLIPRDDNIYWGDVTADIPSAGGQIEPYMKPRQSIVAGEVYQDRYLKITGY